MTTSEEKKDLERFFSVSIRWHYRRMLRVMCDWWICNEPPLTVKVPFYLYESSERGWDPCFDEYLEKRNKFIQLIVKVGELRRESGDNDILRPVLSKVAANILKISFAFFGYDDMGITSSAVLEPQLDRHDKILKSKLIGKYN